MLGQAPYIDSGSALELEIGTFFRDPAKGYPMPDEWARACLQSTMSHYSFGGRIPRQLRERRGIMTQIQQYSYRVRRCGADSRVGWQLAHRLRAGDHHAPRWFGAPVRLPSLRDLAPGFEDSCLVLLSRVHPSLVGGLTSFADAYRIRDLDDLEALDLDSTIDQAVTSLLSGGEE